jgi:hypothetical protein
VGANYAQIDLVFWESRRTGSIPIDLGYIDQLSSEHVHVFEPDHKSPLLDYETRLVKLGMMVRGASVAECLSGDVSHVVVCEERAGIFRGVLRKVLVGRPWIVGAEWGRTCCRDECFVKEF